MVEFFFLHLFFFFRNSCGGKNMSFIDEAKFNVKAGDGGNGCISFRREKYVPKGGPNGGDGGRGGDIRIVANKNIQSLIDFRYKSHFKGERGTHGQGKDMHGRNGKECFVEVPAGSVIKDAETGTVLADLVHHGDTFIAAEGGAGGLGNSHFASGANRTPRFATKGKIGEERWLKIELKLIADIGLVGMPNAGKSTLLSKLSAANPKIAGYPFTTLEPQLGVLHLSYNRSCIIADIPGLIKGASKGVGLGHTFLRHIERTKILLYVIDASDENAVANFKMISLELANYNEDLLSRKRIVVLNKCDITDQRRVSSLRKYFEGKGIHSIEVSALHETHIEELKKSIADILYSDSV
jgi:GTPase